MYLSGKNGRERDDGGSVLMETLICLPVLLLVALGTGQFAHIWYCRQIVQYAAFAGARATLPLSGSPVNPPVTGGGRNMTEEEAGALYAARRICALVSLTQAEGAKEYTRDWLPEGKIGGSGGLAGNPSAENISVWRSGSGAATTLPGWKIGKMTVAVEKPNKWARAVTVRMDVPLLFPFAGQVIGKAMRLYDGDLNLDIAPEGLSTEEADKDVYSHDYANEFDNFFFPHIRLRETAVIGKPFVVTTTGNLPEGYATW